MYGPGERKLFAYDMGGVEEVALTEELVVGELDWPKGVLLVAKAWKLAGGEWLGWGSWEYAS